MKRCNAMKVVLTNEDWSEVLRMLKELPSSETYNWGPSWEFECARRQSLMMKIGRQLSPQSSEEGG